MGRPRKEIDENQLRALCRLKPRIEDVAAFFQCSIDTVEKRIKELGYPSFTVFRQENMVHTRFGLVRKAIQMGEAGNVPMLIFSLKNLCGWTDRMETVERPVKGMSSDELKNEAKLLLEKLDKKEVEQ